MKGSFSLSLSFRPVRISRLRGALRSLLYRERRRAFGADLLVSAAAIAIRMKNNCGGLCHSLI